MFYYLTYYIYIQFISLFNYLIKPDIKKINKNLIVSLTTIPSRSSYIHITLNSILSQTVLPRKIYIGIPKISTREPNINYNFKKLNNIIEIINYDIDYGPVMKLFTGIDKANKDDMIITIDDDNIYEKHTIENLVNSYNNDNSSVYCMIGRNKFGEKKIKYNKKENILTSIEGYGSVIYSSKFFKNDFIDNILDKPFYIKTNDDLYISSYLKNKITIKHVKSYKNEPFSIFIFTILHNPLWIINEGCNLFDMANKELKLFISK